jgi:hypothetical protein
LGFCYCEECTRLEAYEQAGVGPFQFVHWLGSGRLESAFDGELAAAFPGFTQRHVERNAIEPGVESTGARKTIQFFVGSDKRLLSGVLGIGERPTDVCQGIAQPILVFANQ